jgi:hypothetical protein
MIRTPRGGLSWHSTCIHHRWQFVGPSQTDIGSRIVPEGLSLSSRIIKCNNRLQSRASEGMLGEGTMIGGKLFKPHLCRNPNLRESLVASESSIATPKTRNFPLYLTHDSTILPSKLDQHLTITKLEVQQPGFNYPKPLDPPPGCNPNSE